MHQTLVATCPGISRACLAVQDQREGSMLRSITQAHREHSPATGFFMLSAQHPPEEEELDLGTIGTPVMEVGDCACAF